MFDYVGRSLDPEGNRRRALSAGITAAGVAGTIGAVLGVAAWTATQVSRDPPPIIVSLFEPDMADQPIGPAPAAPKATRPAQGGSDDVGPVSLDSPTTDVSDDSPPPSDTPPGAPGTEPGDGGDGPPGTADGEGDGDGVGSGNDGAIVLHHSRLVERRRVLPVWPREAQTQGITVARCVIDVRIDSEGHPVDVSIVACPDAFHTETRRALMGWRWAPPRVNGERTSAHTRIVVTFLQP